MSKNLQNLEDHQVLTIAISFLTNKAREWRIFLNETDQTSLIELSQISKLLLVSIIGALKKKIVRFKLEKFQKLWEAASFIKNFKRSSRIVPELAEMNNSNVSSAI